MSDPHGKQTGATDPRAARKAAAEKRLVETLASIEEAQSLIDRAGAGLGNVRGMAKEGKQLAAIYDRVKSTWCAVNNHARRLRTSGRLVLDREPHAHELREGAGRERLS